MLTAHLFSRDDRACRGYLTALIEPNQRLPCLIACGGTGGHLFPGIAVAQELQRRGHQPLILISEKPIDRLAADGHPELEFVTAPSVAMPRLLSPAMAAFGLRLLRSVRQCRALLRERGTRAVLGMGGFTSLPPLWAARRQGCVTLLHESNAIPGKSNRWCAKFADEVLLGVAGCARHFPNRPTAVTGTPVRTELTRQVDRAAARSRFGLDPDQPVLLVIGGSQGARGVNEAVIAALPELAAQGIGLIHLTGPTEHEAVTAAYRQARGRAPLSAHVAPFCHDMAEAYTAADLVLARSGASTLTELAWFGLPSLLVPYPFAADDHQTLNARVLVEAGAARMIPQPDLTPAALVDFITQTGPGSETRARMTAAARAAAVPDAAARIADRLQALLTLP